MDFENIQMGYSVNQGNEQCNLIVYQYKWNLIKSILHYDSQTQHISILLL